MRPTPLLIIALLAGCSRQDIDHGSMNRRDTGQSETLDVIAPQPEYWPKTKDGIVVNWLGNMVIDGNEYSPFQKYEGVAFKEHQDFRVRLTRREPPEGFGDVKIAPAIRVWIPSVPAMYEKQFPAERLGGSSTIELAIAPMELPPALLSALGFDNLNFAVGYEYDGKWHSCLGGNFIYPPATE